MQSGKWKIRFGAYKSQMDSVSYQYPSDESQIKVGSDGYSKSSLKGMLDEVSKYWSVLCDRIKWNNYKNIRIQNTNIDAEREKQQSNEDYMINCLYRGASFSGSSKDTITYDEYKQQ